MFKGHAAAAVIADAVRACLFGRRFVDDVIKKVDDFGLVRHPHLPVKSLVVVLMWIVKPVLWVTLAALKGIDLAFHHFFSFLNDHVGVLIVHAQKIF